MRKGNVIIYGWFNAPRNHLKKYKDLYTKIGFCADNVYVFETNAFYYMNYLKWMEHQSIITLQHKTKSLQKLYQVQPTVVHICSGGIFNYYNSYCALHKEYGEHKWRPKSIVYDSGIFLPRSDMVVKYFLNHIGCYDKHEMLLLEKVIQCIWFLQGGTPTVLKKHENAIRGLLLGNDIDGSSGSDQEKKHHHQPTLFLNGEHDYMRGFNRFNNLGNQKNNDRFESFTFKKSQHMRLLYDHPDLYMKVIDGFLKKHKII